MDLCFEFATQVMKRLRGPVEVADEVQGFRYFDERDLIGFVDGTESPGGAAGISAAIVTRDDDPDFAGGSYVIVQKYLHDMAAWNAIGIEEQERAIGRTKLDDIEMPDDVKPANSHVALNTITGPDGEERQIVRANMPFGNGARRVRHLLHRLRRHALGDRADAVEHVHRARPAIPTGSSTSPPRSPGACSSPRTRTSSTTRPGRPAGRASRARPGRRGRRAAQATRHRVVEGQR